MCWYGNCVVPIKHRLHIYELWVRADSIQELMRLKISYLQVPIYAPINLTANSLQHILALCRVYFRPLKKGVVLPLHHIIISGFGIYGAAVVPDSGVGNTWQRLTLVLHEFLSNGLTPSRLQL